MDEINESGQLIDDYDSPWKEALELFFEAFMQFYFADEYAAIDWSRGYEFLDTELQQVVREAEFGRRHADKLVKVWLKNGGEQWFLIHIEFQGRPEAAFPERMYVYNYRLYDRHRKPVVSLAVLTDESDTWRPAKFEYILLRCRVLLEFPVVKLRDFRAKWAELEQSTNPFAILTMAHLDTQESRGNYELRMISKLTVVRMLYERGYSLRDVRELFRLIDWLMVLPDNLTKRFDEQLAVIEEKKKMPYMTRYERAGFEKGLVEGRVETLQEVISDLLQDRFIILPQNLADSLKAITDSAKLKNLHKVAARANSLSEFEAALLSEAQK